MTNNKNLVVFEDDTSPIISEILQKYGLKETDDEILEKIEKGEPLKPGIILNLTEDVVAARQSKEAMSSFLQKELSIPKQTAENIAEDIKNKLIPLAKKVSPEEITALEKISEEELSAPLEENDNEEKILYEPLPIHKKIQEEISVVKKPPTPIKEKIPLVKESEFKPRKISKPSQKSDIYREPIDE